VPVGGLGVLGVGGLPFLGGRPSPILLSLASDYFYLLWLLLAFVAIPS